MSSSSDEQPLYLAGQHLTKAYLDINQVIYVQGKSVLGIITLIRNLDGNYEVCKTNRSPVINRINLYYDRRTAGQKHVYSK